ncbi:MAG: glycerol-3-phosphate acyltransferase [Pseudomonadota bacterium]
MDSAQSVTTAIRSLLRFLLNMAKGFALTSIGMLHDPFCALIAAYAVYIGHNYPVWSTFRGGAGLGSIIGGLLVLDPILCLHALVAWGAAFYVFQKPSTATITAAVATPITGLFVATSFSTFALWPMTALLLWRYRILFAEAFDSPQRHRGIDIAAD